MRFALLAAPLLPLVVALAAAGPRVADGLPRMPTVPLPQVAEYRISTLRPDGAIVSAVAVLLPVEPVVHITGDDRWSVGVLGVVEIAPALPPRWCYLIERID